MTVRQWSGLLLVGMCLVSVTSSAHHGGSVYDTSEPVTLRGQVTQFRFVFPHVLVYFAVQGGDGDTVEWSGELTTPLRLARGVGGGGASNDVRWTTETLQPGDLLEVTGDPARNGAPSMRIRRIVDATGQALLGGNEGDVRTATSVESAAPESASGVDLSGVWMRRYNASYQNYAFTEEPPSMTAWARERFEATKPTFGPRGVAVVETNDPAYQCLPPGTPRIYAHPAPFEIVHTSDRVMLAYEYQNRVRHVFTDGREHREGRPPTWMGESIGRWEGETLIVDTRNFNDQTWLDRRGLPHSDQLRVLERISRSGENGLTIEITVEDPVAFPDPWTAQRVFERVDWRLEESVCLDNASFSEYERSLLDYSGDSASSQ